MKPMTSNEIRNTVIFKKFVTYSYTLKLKYIVRYPSITYIDNFFRLLMDFCPLNMLTVFDKCAIHILMLQKIEKFLP